MIGAVPFIPSESINETLIERQFAIQPKTKALLEHTTLISGNYKKIEL